MSFIGKKIVVYGAGASGLSASQLLREKGAIVALYDDDPRANATSDASVFDDADMIVLSPGVRASMPHLLAARLEGKPVVGELELASSLCVAEQIAVTGTNGKTTTTMMINGMFRRAGISSHAVGNIGNPFCAIADRLDENEIAVIEASSFQLETCENFSPDTAVLLNITPDHLDRHGSMQQYAALKSKIFLRQSEADTVIYNADDEVISDLVPLMTAKRVPFSASGRVKGAYISSGMIFFDGKLIMPVDYTDMRGRELENVLATVAVGMTHGLSPYAISAAIQEFSRPAFRRQTIGEIDGIKVINDSKATNIYACISAVEATEGDIVLILGGSDMGEDFDELFDRLPQRVRAICVTGENEDGIVLSARGRVDCVRRYADLKSALMGAVAVAKAVGADNILFSPASKSFDRYKNYEERGRSFDRAFAELKG